jgi:hypothetical protein
MYAYPYLLTASDDLKGLGMLLECILTSGRRNGTYLEILGCLLSMDFRQDRWETFCNFRELYLATGGESCQKGWDRATRVYTTRKDKPTKPSYLNRLVAFPDKPRRLTSRVRGLNQIDKISIELAKKPGFSNLSFVILRPADLHDQFRPGYVPCAIAGDFKFRNGRIDLNVMFRTSDALSVGYADIYYMRQLQMQVLKLASSLNSSLSTAQVGLLNMYLCRTYVQRAQKNRNGVRTDGLKAANAVVKLIKAQAGS